MVMKTDYFWIWLIEGLVISILGCILHFTYAWSHQNKFVAIFSAVNESTWEHIKLALSGIFACTLVDVWLLGDNPNYWFCKSISFLVPILMIPAIFYGYTAFTKRPILAIDISSFVVASFASTLTFTSLMQLAPMGLAGSIMSMLITVVVLALYLSWTRFPIHGNRLFRDPITGKYGYEGHRPYHRHDK